MRGDEERVIDIFCRWLESRGWTIKREVDFIDILAERGAERLYAEAKGRTSVIGLDVDILYGQLLRRMSEEETEQVRFGAVVPEEGRNAALRVPRRVRNMLRIDIFVVNADGQVEQVENI